MEAERIASEVADRVRTALAEAEQRAAAIVRDAEEEAERIRARAESQGQQRLEEVRRALAELEGRLGAAGGGESEVDPGPVTVPEPTPDPVPEPGPAPVPEPTPERIPEPTPPPDEGTPPAPQPPEPATGRDAEGAPADNGADAAGGGRSADIGAARLVAMNMALGGSSRDEIDAALAAGYALDDRAKMIDEVLAKAGR